MRIAPLLTRSLSALALAFVSTAQAATPGVVQGATGWYEDIRFHAPGSAEVPTRVGTDVLLYDMFPAMTFQTATQGTLMVDSWDMTADWSATLMQTLDTAWRGLGAGADGMVNSNETMHLLFNTGGTASAVSLVGLELFFVTPLTTVDLWFGELPTRLSVGDATVTTVDNITRAQWWFAQPYTSANGEFTLTNGQGAYYLGSVQIAAVPEPESIALLLAGVAVVGGAVWRRRAQTPLLRIQSAV